jgi:curved DNA-binding protein CbpA
MSAQKNKIDFYEFLQISPHADQETIHRVYRFLAARFHPDNPGSGDQEQFATLTAAYDVLSDPVRRAEYDTTRAKQAPAAPPLSSSIDFMDSVAGERNRRLAVLAVLYFRRRTNAVFPEVSLADLEMRMGFPRDYLDFTTWYLQKKGYITKADNSDFSLTASGVDYVETQRAQIPILQRLLTNGSEPNEHNGNGTNGHIEEPGEPRFIVLPDSTRIRDRRKSTDDRRHSPHERRHAQGDHRLASGEDGHNDEGRDLPIN